jgi:hypothetical protein
MDEKRPIDRRREAGGMMSVGTAGDTSAIKEVIPIGGTLHIVKEKGIYACKLADQIDPERSNPNIPNVQQRVLAYGTESNLVRQTLLTAKKLFNPSYLSSSFDHEAALVLAFEALKDLAAMQDIVITFIEIESSTKLEDRRQKDGSVVLPSIGDVSARCKSFIQKSDHALQSLLGIVKLFYGKDAVRWFESFAKSVASRYGVEDPFTKFMRDALPFLQFVRNARNSIEHPKKTERMVTTDYVLNSEMQIVPPSIQIIHPRTPQPAMQISVFMTQLIEQSAAVFELMLAQMCDRHVQSVAGIQFQVIELPEEWQRAHNVRYSYGLYDGDRVIPAG